MTNASFVDQIPRVDIPLDGGFSESLQEEVFRGLSEFGLVLGYAPEVHEAALSAYGHLPDFFEHTPLHERKSLCVKGANRERGFGPLGEELGLHCRRIGPDGKGAPDQKEMFMVGPESQTNDPVLLEKYPHMNLRNVWPENLPGFRASLVRGYQLIEARLDRVLACIEEPLGVPPGFFDQATKNGGSTIMRAICFQALESLEPWQRVWACKHYDLGIITGVSKGSVPGFRLYDRRAKKMVPIDVPDNFMVIQVGKSLEIISRGQLHAADHEVGPMRFKGQRLSFYRYVLAMFKHGRSDFVLNPDTGLTVGEFVSSELDALGLK